MQIYTAPTGGTALAQFSRPYNSFNGTNLYVEGIAPGTNTLAWSYSEQPKCVDNIQVTVVKILVTNIKFNHDTTSSLNDAINIRQDFITPLNVANGEWVSGGVNLPACYKANSTVSIKARFTVEPNNVTCADIWATSVDVDGSLGNVPETSVLFSGGTSVGDVNGYVEMSVSGTTPSIVKKTTTDTWRWKMKDVNGTVLAACDMNMTGPHTVYTILAEPISPWVNTDGNQRNAWVKALDFAVVDAQCNGSTSEAIALGHIAQYLHTGFSLTYDNVAGDNAYASTHLGGNMNLTGYIDKSSGNIVNCYDQAAGVCAIGRLLGIAIEYRFMDPFGYINEVNLVGEGNCNNPFYGNPNITGGKIAGVDAVEPVRAAFGNHAFAKYGSLIYDACAGPNIGSKTESQYISDTVDVSTPAEAYPWWCAPEAAGDPANIITGSVNDVH